MECELCGKKFTQKRNLSRHISNICRVGLENKVAVLEQKLAEATVYINELEKKLLVVDLEKRLAFHEGEQLLTDHLKDQTIRYEKHILKENSKPRNSVIINNLAPFDLTLEQCEQICKDYTVEHFIRGPEATYLYVLNDHFKDKDGNLKMICTDTARQIFKGKTIDGKEFVDVGGLRIPDIVKPLRRAIWRAGNELSGLNDMDDEVIEAKRKKHYRELESKRLNKRLASDLRP